MADGKNGSTPKVDEGTMLRGNIERTTAPRKWGRLMVLGVLLLATAAWSVWHFMPQITSAANFATELVQKPPASLAATPAVQGASHVASALAAASAPAPSLTQTATHGATTIVDGKGSEEKAFPPGFINPREVTTVVTETPPVKVSAPVAAKPPPVKASAPKPAVLAVGQKSSTVKVATTPKQKQVKSEKSAQPVVSAAPASAVVSTPSTGDDFTLVKHYEQIFLTGKQKGWERPNAAPCRKHMGCTVGWGLSQSEWPAEARAGLAHKISTESPERMKIPKGMRFDFMASANARGPWMDRNVIAAWADNARTEPASYWDYEYDSKLYRYVVPDICGNISGQVFSITYEKVPVAKATPSKSTIAKSNVIERPRLTVQDVDDILGMAPVGECN